MSCTRLAQNTGCKQSPKIHHMGTVAQLCPAISLQPMHVSTIGKKTCQTAIHMSSQYGELRPTSGWDLLVSLGHPSKFQPVSRLGFVTAATSLTGDQRSKLCATLGQLLGWCTIYTFWGSCPLTEFCQVQNSRYVQVLRSPILAALLQGTPAAGVSQTLRRGTRNGITELSQRAPSRLGGHHVGHRSTF